jgi:hypothetical protein
VTVEIVGGVIGAALLVSALVLCFYLLRVAERHY